MKEFGPHNYSRFFKDITDGERFRVPFDDIPLDTVNGVALCSGFKVYREGDVYTAMIVETTKVEVELNRFQDGAIREVFIDKNDLTDEVVHNLEVVFKWGQNDFQPVPQRCSVSVGDVIRFNGARYEVEPVGFKKVD